MSPEQPTPETPVTPVTPEVTAEAPQEPVVEVPVAAVEAPATETQDMIGMPPGYEPKPVEAPAEPIVDENAQAIARAKIIENQAMLQRMTPPAPGTPVETFVPPVMSEPTPSVETAPAAPAEAAPIAPPPVEFSTEAAVEAANRVSEPSTETPEVPQQ